MMSPCHFTPYLKRVIWGGSRIPQYKGIETDTQNIGESWELSAVPGHVSVVDRGPYRGKTLDELVADFGESLLGRANAERYGKKFPLLVKFIDAAQDLSVQVHPGDELARRRHNSSGKNEMWSVIKADEGARIYSGFSHRIDKEEFRRRIADNSIMDVVAAHDSHTGDVFFIPSGRIHSIGAGNLLVEIQQSSDVTYRIYDFDRCDDSGKPRELHTDLAEDAVDFSVSDNYRSYPEGERIVECENFIVHRLSIADTDAPRLLPHVRDAFTIVVCLDGALMATSEVEGKRVATEIRRGETILFPASMPEIEVSGNATILSVQG